MSIIRVRKNANYFSASNEPFNDIRLSWESRGLMGYLLSKPNNWQVRMTDLKNKGTARRDKLKRMLAELQKYGYVNRILTKDVKGRFEWITEVYESPSQNPSLAHTKRATIDGKSVDGQTDDRQPGDILSTKETNTKKIKTNIRGGGEKPASTWRNKKSKVQDDDRSKYIKGEYADRVEH